MTQEEKYKKALLEARAVLEPCLKYSKGKVREALDSIDKELKSFESEDERIRKELKEAFEAYDIESKWNGIPIRSIFAWLEKQKERKPAVKVVCKVRDGQKEGVEPVDWSKTKINGKPVSAENNAVNIPLPEWTSFDETVYKSIKSILLSESRFVEERKWFNSLPERFNLQPKQEWSEEDENNIGWIVAFLQGEEGSGEVIELMRESLISWLKSLRPHWKPSEEQMKVFDGLYHNYILDKNDHKVLESLYEQLKKL